MLRISAQTKRSNYVRQLLLPKLGFKTLISQDLEYAEFSEAYAAWISEGEMYNKV